MTLGELYSYIDYLTNKDQFGKQLSLENYKVLLTIVNSQYFRDEFQKIIPALTVNGDEEMLKIFNNSPLYRFLNSADLTLTAGLGTLPTTLGSTLNGTALIGTSWKFARFVSIEEADRRKYNILTPDLSEKPIFTQTPTGYQFTPKTIVSAKVNYLREVVNPYFDYCIDSDDKIIYMPVGSLITLTGVLQDAAGNTLATDVTHINSPTLPYTSVSLEFDWDEVDKVVLSNKIIELVMMRSGQVVPQQNVKTNERVVK